jgi:AcrR family transcriptional regulator
MATRSVKQRLRAGERRQLIVDAALREFAERGYEAASMGRIAAAAGVTRTVLYDHFPSKHALFVELLGFWQRALLSHLEVALGGSGSMRSRMRGTFDAFFAFAEEHPVAWRVLSPEHPPLDPAAAAEMRRCRGESNRLLASLLVADARRAGIDPESAVGRAVFAMHQEALHGAVRWWRGHPEVPRDELVEAAMATLWSGLGVAERPQRVETQRVETQPVEAQHVDEDAA